MQPQLHYATKRIVELERLLLVDVVEIFSLVIFAGIFAKFPNQRRIYNREEAY